MDGKRLVLIASAVTLLAALAAFYLTVHEGPRTFARILKERVLSSAGWAFEERVNCTDAYAVVKGNVSLVERVVATSIVALPAGGQPRVYMFFANESASFVNIDGAWLKVGGGWRVEDALLLGLLDLAAGAEEAFSVRSGSIRLVFSGTCSAQCLRVFQSLAGLAGSALSQAQSYSGELEAPREGAPLRLRVEFRDAQGRCRVEYNVAVFGAQPVSFRP